MTQLHDTGSLVRYWGELDSYSVFFSFLSRWDASDLLLINTKRLSFLIRSVQQAYFRIVVDPK